MLWNESESCSVVSDSLRPHGLYSPWNSPGQNTGVGSLPLLQEIFPTQGSNPGVPHCRWILYQLSHKGSPSNEIEAYDSAFWVLPDWDCLSWPWRVSQASSELCLSVQIPSNHVIYSTSPKQPLKQIWNVSWKWKLLSCVWLFATSYTIQSMEVSRPEHWSG